MKQIKKKTEKPEEQSKGFQKKFEELKKHKVEHADTRIVNVRIRIGCGCGGGYEWFHGEVPIDSKITDGRHFDDVGDFANAGAKNIEYGRYESN